MDAPIGSNVQNCRPLPSHQNPFDLVKRHVVAAPVVKLGRRRRRMSCHPLRNFELSAVFQVRVMPVAQNVWQLIGRLMPATRSPVVHGPHVTFHKRPLG